MKLDATVYVNGLTGDVLSGRQIDRKLADVLRRLGTAERDQCPNVALLHLLFRFVCLLHRICQVLPHSGAENPWADSSDPYIGGGKFLREGICETNNSEL